MPEIPPVAPPPYDTLQLIRNDGVGLIDIVEFHDPGTPVPSCPGWTLADLAWHIGEVWDFWGRVVEQQITDPAAFESWTEPDKLSGAALLEWVTASHTAIYGALVDARPEREVWTWTGANRNVEWVRRRMAQETAVHRWDAAHAVGQPDDIDAVVAADGIDEFLSYFANVSGIDGEDLGGTVHLHCTDTAGEWFVSSLTPDGIAFTREHTKGEVAVRGSASDLLLWLWRRPAGSVDIIGDAALGARFQQASTLE
jgi:uncharacterized protein (TIGR03083 family)